MNSNSKQIEQKIKKKNPKLEFTNFYDCTHYKRKTSHKREKFVSLNISTSEISGILPKLNGIMNKRPKMKNLMKTKTE